jgi:chemotaxis signal transduction protein
VTSPHRNQPPTKPETAAPAAGKDSLQSRRQLLADLASGLEAGEPLPLVAAEPEEDGTPWEDVLVFDLGGGRCAVDAASVEEVLPLPRLTSLPGTDPMVRGLFQNRGELILGVDIALALGWPAWKPSASSRVLIVRDSKACTGLLVHGVAGILRLPPGSFNRPAVSVALDRVCTGAASVDGEPVAKLELKTFLETIEHRLARSG